MTSAGRREDTLRSVSEGRELRLDAWARPGPVSGDAALDWVLHQAQRSLRGGDLDKGLSLLDRALPLAKDVALRAEIHLAAGEVQRQREEWSRALVHFREAADLAPARAEAWYQLGLAHAQLENARAASEALRVACRLSPDDPDVLRALAVTLSGQGEDAEADRCLARALETAPDDVRLLEAAASHHLKMGRFTECGEILSRATELAPENRFIRRLAKETSYLVDLAAEARPAAEAPARPHLRVALPGGAGEVERALLASMEAAGFDEAQRRNARDLWRDYLEARGGHLRPGVEHAAAVELLIARLDFVDRSGRDVVARRHRVAEPALMRAYQDLVETLDVSVFDQRYCTQAHPVEQVGDEASRTGMPPEDIYRALLEDEYREYEETHDRERPEAPKLTREAFEDASVEYGSLLTREMMGLSLGKRERMRRRELERFLLVT